MHYRQIDTFRAVIISGSASRAAKMLDITQPAVSRAIAELEKSVGFPLFDRTSGRLSPTAEGSLLFTEVDKAFVGLDKLRAEAARIRDFGMGAIRIASLSALGNTLVPRAIRAFQKRHPRIPLTLQIHASSMVRELVVSGSFHMGLAADEVDLTGVHHQDFGMVHAVCALPPGHPLAKKPFVEAADLHKRNFIALAPEDRARHRLEAVLRNQDIRPQIVAETPSSITVCALVLAGVGIGMVNPTSAAGLTDAGLILRPLRPQIEFRSVLLFREDISTSQTYKGMIDELLKARSYFSFKGAG